MRAKGTRKKKSSRRVFRRYGRRYRRKTFLPRGKRARGAKVTTLVNKYNSLWPDVTYAKLKYFETFEFKLPATTAPMVQVYRGNSIYDPDLTGSGHQPYGYDVYGGMYKSYYVLGSSISLRCTMGSATNEKTSSVRFYVVPLDVTTPLGQTQGTDTTYGETPRIKTATGTYYGHNPVYLKHYAHTGTVFGLKPNLINSTADFSALVSANPASEWYWHIYAHTIDTAATASTTYVEVMMTYYVKFFTRVTPTYSTA